ncbi:hypothetical protein AB0H86_12750 [Streptomyces sp. NPDC050997]|uniref:hypothetical protein n=1 Tax=Streptomyces sp. NPDC050997 TaxID=3155519 RepID=UPI0034177A95
MTTGTASPESNPDIPLPESTDSTERVAPEYAGATVAECRPAVDVFRRPALPHRTPRKPHRGAAAVRVAAVGRPVEVLVDLIGRLAEERRAFAQPPDPAAVQAPVGPAVRVEAVPAVLGPGAITAHPVDTPISPREAATPPCEPARLVVLALVVCGVLGFPLDRDGASARVYGFALAMSVLCVFVALVLSVRSTVSTLVVAVVVPATVAAVQLLEGSLVHSAGLSRALDLALAPAWIAGTAGVVASLAALTALVARLAWQLPRGTTARPMADATRSAG